MGAPPSCCNARPIVGAPNSIIAAAIAQPLQFLANPHQRQPLTPRLAWVCRRQIIEVRCPRPQLGQWLLGLSTATYFSAKVAE
jgi:hypothetical protein